MGLSREQMLDEPVDDIAEALLIWSLQAERDKLESGTQQA